MLSMTTTEQAEDKLEKIWEAVKSNSTYEYEIPKDKLILIISKFVANPYPYINMLLGRGFIEEISPTCYRILK